MSQLEPLKEKAGNACGDKDQKCCICIPLETGMKILGCLFCLGAILIGLGLVQCIAYNIIIAIVIGVILLPYLYLCFIWFKWMREDNEENCKMVVKAMNIYKIVAWIFSELSLAAIFQEPSTLVSALINFVLNLLFVRYYPL